MRTEFAPSWPVSIFIAGDYETAMNVCGAHCDEVGLCVTITLTDYVYTNGTEGGLIVGLINYPRFPAEPAQIEARAIELGMKLREGLRQESFSIQTPTTTTWFSWREADSPAQGIEAGTATTPKSGVVHESPVAEGDAPNPEGSIHEGQ